MKIILSILFLFIVNFIYCQEDISKSKTSPEIPDSAFENMGVSVSPSSMHLFIKPGTSVLKEIRIKNSTKQLYKFNINYCDFEMGRNGKPLSLKSGEGKYGLSKWINVAPSYFELKPQEELKLKVVIEIPDIEDAYHAAWTIITIDQVIDREPLDAVDKPNRISMGITPSIGFGIYVYQNPPNVKINSVQIDKFLYKDSLNKRKIEMVVKNTGDGISYCTSYVELTNTKTGKQDKLKVKRFTILPQFFRDFNYELPIDLPSGNYTAVGVVDFGSSEEIIAAQAEFVVP